MDIILLIQLQRRLRRKTDRIERLLADEASAPSAPLALFQNAPSILTACSSYLAPGGVQSPAATRRAAVPWLFYFVGDRRERDGKRKSPAVPG